MQLMIRLSKEEKVGRRKGKSEVSTGIRVGKLRPFCVHNQLLGT